MHTYSSAWSEHNILWHCENLGLHVRNVVAKFDEEHAEIRTT